MENVADYQELIIAIESLAEKDVWDYVIAIAPIILSVIAVFISVDVARQQNRIALFEKRFNVYVEIQRCLSFERLLKESNGPQGAYIAFCIAYGLDSSIEHIENGWASRKYIPIEKTLMQSCFLFDCINEQMISNICKSLLAVLFKIEKQQDVEKEKVQFEKNLMELLRCFSDMYSEIEVCRKEVKFYGRNYKETGR